MGPESNSASNSASNSRTGGTGGVGADVREWLWRLSRGEARAESAAALPRVGHSTGQYLRVAGLMFQVGLGGAIPASCEELTAAIRGTGARVEGRLDAPAGWEGAHIGECLYINAALPQDKRRRVAYQLWARYLCWRDRGGPPASVYEESPGMDGYGRVAEYFQRIATAADPVQPRREPTIY